MATSDWTLLVLCWPSCSEGKWKGKGGEERGGEGREDEKGRGREGREERGGCSPIDFTVSEVKTIDASCFRLFKNLTKEVRLYAQKFIDKGRVSGHVPSLHGAALCIAF